MLTNGVVLVTIHPSLESHGRYLSASIGSSEMIMSAQPFGIRSEAMGLELMRRLTARLHPLAHAVDLGLFNVEALLEGSFSYDGSDGEDSLSSHTGEYYIFFHCVLFFA